MTDKQWISLYHFWQLQYELRYKLLKNYKKYINKRKLQLELASNIDCKKYKNAMKGWINSDYNFISQLIIPDIPCNKSSEYCKSCKYSTDIIKKFDLVKKYANLNEAINNYTYEEYQLILDSTNFIYQIILFKKAGMSDSEILVKYVYTTPVQRQYINEGIRLLGIENLKLKKDGHLTGKVIAEIDLFCSTSLLRMKVETLKSLKFIKIPTFDKLYSAFKIEHIGYSKKEIKDIKDNLDLRFRENSFNSRAIGLWLYDVTEAKKYKTYDDASEALKDGRWIGQEFAQKNNVVNALDLLGKGASDPAVFRHLLKKTTKCVDERDVISLK